MEELEMKMASVQSEKQALQVSQPVQLVSATCRQDMRTCVMRFWLQARFSALLEHVKSCGCCGGAQAKTVLNNISSINMDNVANVSATFVAQ